MIVESLEFDLDIGGLHNLVDLSIFLTADEFTVLIRQFNLETNFVMESLWIAVSINITMIRAIYLDDIEFHYHIDGRPDFRFKTMHLEAHTLENHLRSSRNRDLLE